MSIDEIGAFLFILVIIFLFSNIWFHFIESILSRIKRIFTRHKEPKTWHPLPQDKDD